MSGSILVSLTWDLNSVGLVINEQCSSLVGKAIGEAWQKRAQAGDERVPKEFLKPSPLVERLVSEGKLGIKTGEGIFKYNK